MRAGAFGYLRIAQPLGDAQMRDGVGTYQNLKSVQPLGKVVQPCGNRALAQQIRHRILRVV